MYTTRGILYVLASLFVAFMIRSSRGQMYSNKRLCESLSQKAVRQRLKLCERSEDKPPVVRLRRHVNTTQETDRTSTQTIQTSTPSVSTKRPLSSYTCTTQPKSPNGFIPDRKGLDLTAKCVWDGNWWSAVITWEIPKIEAGRSDCVGYYIEWDSPDGYYCDYIMDKNVTSYFMDSSKGWAEFSDGDYRLWIVVFPLPQTKENHEIIYRSFLPPRCSDPTTSSPSKTSLMVTSHGTRRNTDPTTSSSLKTSSMVTPHGTRNNAVTTTTEHTISTSTSASKNPGKIPQETPAGKSPGKNLKDTPTTKIPGKNPKAKKSKSDGPVVNKLVFSIVITSIAVVILAIVFVLYKKRNNSNSFDISDSIGNNNQTFLQGAPHYISYNAYNKNEAKDIARWLHEKNVNVIIDIFSVIKTNQRAWSEQQLSAAEKIIMVITPRYLEICNFHQSLSKKEKKLGSYNDELTYNEISLIKNRLVEKAPDKFIAILIETKEKDLPHWMPPQLNCYKYKNGKLDEEILKTLKPFHGFA